MNLLQISYLGLCIASLFGAILFVGYSFHIKVRYPLAIVILHWTVAAATFLLFSAWEWRQFAHPSTLSAPVLVFEAVTYAIFAATLGTGLFFFAKYDARRRQLRIRMVGVHVLMACMTFIAVTSLLSVATPSQPNLASGLKVFQTSGRWPILHRNKAIHEHFQKHPAVH